MAHEFGHFIVAVKSGVKVLEFSLGMGPLLWQKETKTTKYSVRLLPIGGYCKMVGEDEQEDSPVEGSLNAISPFKKILVLAAGALMNFAIAILIFFVIFAYSGVPTTTLSEIVANSPAEKAGIEAGDTILSVDNVGIDNWEDLSQTFKITGARQVEVKVRKSGGAIQTYEIVPEYNPESQSYMIGVVTQTKTDLWDAFISSFETLGQFISGITGVFIGLLRGEGLNELMGPIGATAVIGQSISAGLINVLAIAAAISVSLGFFNLLPIPALDGSRILFTIVFVIAEKIKGSAINKKWEAKVHLIGFVALMLLAVIIAYKDIISLL